MGILIEKDKGIFHLQTKHTSYILAVAQGKYLAHVYWGKRIRTPEISRALPLQWRCFDVMEPGPEQFSLDFICREYPTSAGDYRTPALAVEYGDGSRECVLDYEGYRVIQGKPPLPGLPSVYAESEAEAETLEIELMDRLKGLSVTLVYTVFEEYDAITRSVRIENKGTDKVRVNRAASLCVDFEHSDFELLTLPGAWGRERHIERRRLSHGLSLAGSARGASSHQMNPFLALLAPGTDEARGDVYGINLVYSGNFTGGAEVDQMHKCRLFLGLGNEDFSWLLEPSERFVTPEAVMVFSGEGLGGMSRIYHRLYRERLIRGVYRDRVRPVLVNNWEATYFDFTQEKIVSLAETAAELGIELLVLDDGWFGKRDSDNCSLGDWTPHPGKLPEGLKGLAEKVRQAGVRFGLWVEPEMVSVDSDLYRSHPDWCIHAEGRERSECRQQLTLDLSRDEVCEYLIDTLRGLLESAPISYIKWDMNRHMSNLGSPALPPERQREQPHRYMLGLYRVMEEITNAFPEVLFESCSGGGGRFDPGMLYYMPQTWTSDDTDAVERLYIQYGTSLAYPLSSMGAHVSAVPNHQSGRVTPLKTRGDAAMSGNFGYELDLTSFSAEEREEVKEQVAFYKEIRELIMEGDFYRLLSPFEGNRAAWMVLSRDKKEIFAACFGIMAEVNPATRRVKLQGLDPEATYRDREDGQRYGGDELMEIGLAVEFHGDYQSRVWRLEWVG